MGLLTSLAKKEDLKGIQAHLAEYGKVLQESTRLCFCTNAALNALLVYYHDLAVSAGVDTDWRIELPDPLPFTELEMVALFGNLIENAIDGCRTLPEGKRFFSLTAEIGHGNRLYIVSTNSFDGKVRKKRDGYHSTKHSGKGIGLSAIRSTTEKYGGSVRISHDEKEFYVDAVLSLQD